MIVSWQGGVGVMELRKALSTTKIYSKEMDSSTSLQCWGNYFLKATRYILILLATELFSYSYILPTK